MLRDVYEGHEFLWFVVAVLGTWRITSLLCFDDGPFDAIARLRGLAARYGFARLLECFHCLSVWIALAITVAVYELSLLSIVLWWAIAGGASLVEGISQRQQVIDFAEDDF